MKHFKKANFLAVLFLALIGSSLFLKSVSAMDVCCCGCNGEKGAYVDVSMCDKASPNYNNSYDTCAKKTMDECDAQCKSANKTTPPPAPRKAITLQDPLKLNAGGNEVQVLIGRVIQTILGLVGSIALLMFVYGGFLWMTAAGNEERVKKGKEILIWASLGLAIIFASYILVFFLLKTLLGLSG